MTTIVFGFPGGLYHATPWGHHVNEGQVEWPPSPWRLLRALVAVGHSALGWDEGVPSAAPRLVEALASAAPSYTLPPASVAHTRHWMPLGKFKGSREDTTLVLDSFARPGDGELAVTWPTDLNEDERSLLGELVRHMNYLGRSESWVEGRLLTDKESVPQGRPCVPDDGGGPPDERHYEKIRLTGPLSATEYRAWLANLPPQPAGKRSKKAAAAAPPADLWGCVTQSTSELQAAGWSRPPGSRGELYWRPEGALTVGAPSIPRLSAAAPAECMLLSLSLPSGNLHALPSVTRTLPTAELLHRSAVSLLGRGSPVAEGRELIGRSADGVPLTGHQHAHILPLDLDRDGHLEHVLVWAPGGLGTEAINALRRLRKTWAKDLAEDIRVAVAAVGSARDFASTEAGPWGEGLSAAVGPSRVWTSATPFLPPRYLKPRGKNTLEGQVLAELESRGFGPVEVRPMDREVLFDKRFRHFVRERRAGPSPKAQHWFGLQLTFDRPVHGPLCLGYASHFGMGRFEATR